jgi:drug/metabolite transporter (DMT)-like permease
LTPLAIGLALTAALAAAGRETLVKRAMHEGDEVAIAFILTAVTAAVLLPVSVLRGAPPLGAGFATALLVSGGINAVAAVLIARAVHRSDLSLVSPLQSTTPLFMLPTGLVLLGELPDARGMAGVLVIVAGGYVLNMRDRTAPLLAPFAALAREPGARLFLLVAALFSVSAAVDKIGVLASAPLFWAGAVNAFAAGALLLGLAARQRVPHVRRVLAGAGTPIVAAGVITAVGIGAQMTALPLTLAAYVIAVKRTSVLFSVIAGRVVFGERGTRLRFVGAAVMVAGVALLV